MPVLSTSTYFAIGANCNSLNVNRGRLLPCKRFSLFRATAEDDFQTGIPGPSQPSEIPQPSIEATPVKSASVVEGLIVPEWMPEQGVEVLKFLSATDFDIKTSKIYKERLAKYVETEIFQQSVGFKQLPEIINGRIAMVGFLTGVLAEIFGAGSMIYQFGKFPTPVLIFTILIPIGSITPIYKGIEGDYMDSLKDQYSVPPGIFTEDNERLHARLAMIGVGVIFLVEMLSNNALF
eukprot:TRINITY_DN24604_c0_g1_i3.p2 TRINITY_DN24604_c0_g1~~TRINITY_DN24604_c0_g1_i3.p2  ORF type:complete len:257 (-),score=20.62 TRINITY_DN24604_c0_g1_i3:370-1074(-)